MNLLNKFIILFLFFIFCCSSAELRPEKDSYLTDESKQKSISSKLIEDCEAKSKTFNGVDIWNDTLPYLFTPLDSKNSKFSLKNSDNITFESDRKKITVSEESSTLDRIYIESLLLYSDFLSQLCTPEKTQLFAQTKFSHLDKIALYFQSKQGNTTNEYIIYFNNDLPAAAEFTYRDLSDSYIGILRFSDWATMSGKLMPTTIEILDTLEDTRPIHEVRIYEYSRAD